MELRVSSMSDDQTPPRSSGIEQVPRILVVDDEREIRDLLKRHLSYEGFEVETVAGGHEALDALRKHPARVLVTDITMPQMNGLELIDRVKDAFPHIRIVVMTGRTNEDTITSCMRSGAGACVLKPLVDMKAFVRTVRHSVAMYDHWEAVLATVRDRARSIGKPPISRPLAKRAS